MDDSHSNLNFAEHHVDLSGKKRSRFFSVRRLVALLVILLVLGGVAWLLTPRGSDTPRNGRAGANAPMPVAVAPAQKGDMPIVINALGTVTPVTTVTVKTQINGNLVELGFKEGQAVNKGDFIAQIDPRPYQVALQQAEGTQAKDQALLSNARVDLARYKKLVAQDSIAEQTLATQESLVRQYEGTVKNDEGIVAGAKLNLAYCHIVAPVAGRVGLRQVDLGNYVTPGDTNGIVVITQLHPITVVFTIPEDSLPDVMKKLHSGEALKVMAYDRSHSRLLSTGTLETIDNEIDTSTGTVKLKAVFANDDESLFANQFVNVDLLLDTQHDALLVPTTAILRGAPGIYVYLVDQTNTVHVQVVTLGAASADKNVIASGLSAGDVVVTDGGDRLRDGAQVVIPDNTATPTAPKRQGRRRDGANGGDTPQPGRGQGSAQ